MDTTGAPSTPRVADPERAGGCGHAVAELDVSAAAAGVAQDGIEPARRRRILRLTEPDGDRVVPTD